MLADMLSRNAASCRRVDLRGRVAFVTGGSRGLGAALSVGLGALGVGIVALKRRRNDVTDGRARASRSVTIRGDAQTLYALWRESDRLAPTVETRLGAGATEIVEDVPGKRYEWRTCKKNVNCGGALTFAPAPGERGTQVRLSLYLTGPGAKALAVFARLTGTSPGALATESLRRFKALAEAGEIPVAVRS